MANAKKCDKCGFFYDPYVVKDAVSVNGRYATYEGTVMFPMTDVITVKTKTYDLCPTCFTNITSLLNIELYVEKEGGDDPDAKNSN